MKNEKIHCAKSLVVDGNTISLDCPYALSVLGIDKIAELIDWYEWHRKDVVRFASIYVKERKYRDKLWVYIDELLPVINRLKFEFDTRLIQGI